MDALATDTIPRAVILADVRGHIYPVSNKPLRVLVVVEATCTGMVTVTLLLMATIILEPPLLVIGLKMGVAIITTTEELDASCVGCVLTLVAVVVKEGGVAIAITTIDSRATVYKMHALGDLGMVLLDMTRNRTSEHCKGLLTPRNRALEGCRCACIRRIQFGKQSFPTRRNGGSSRSIHNNNVGRHTT
jgi:hypothetical protein